MSQWSSSLQFCVWCQTAVEKKREKEKERVKCSKRGRVKCGEWENDDLIGDEVEEDKVEDNDDAKNFGVLVCRLIFGYNSMMEANLLKEKGHVRA